VVRTHVYFGSALWEFLPRFGHIFPFFLSNCLSGNGDLNLDTSVDVDNDLLDDLGGGVEVNQALVDAHLEAVPGLGTLTARGLAGGDLEGLGGQADGALDAEVLVLAALDDLGADLLEDLDLAGGEGDADLVALGSLSVVLVGLLVRHFGG
jgi:hypothetical protein